MSDSIRPHRWPWIVGILMLAISAVGAAWALNHSGGGNGSSAEDKENTPPPSVVCLGYVDVDPGIAHLHPLQQGRIEWVEKEGAMVKKGDPLLKLEAKLAKAKVDEAKADLDNAIQQVEKAKKGKDQRQIHIDMQEKVILAAEETRKAAEADVIIKRDVQKAAKSIVEATEALVRKLDAIVQVEKLKLREIKLADPEIDVSRAEADVAAKQAQLEQAQVGYDEMVLKAPADGMLLRVMVQAGEVLGGSPKFAAIQFAPRGPKIVRAEVLQEWASKVQVGQTVKIEDDTYMGDKWDGKVVRLSHYFAQKRSPVIEPFTFNDVRTIECIIEILPKENAKGDAKEPELRIGQRVRARIKTAS